MSGKHRSQQVLVAMTKQSFCHSSSTTTSLDDHGGTGLETRCHFTMASIQLAQPWGKAPKV